MFKNLAVFSDKVVWLGPKLKEIMNFPEFKYLKIDNLSVAIFQINEQKPKDGNEMKPLISRNELTRRFNVINFIKVNCLQTF